MRLLILLQGNDALPFSVYMQSVLGIAFLVVVVVGFVVMLFQAGNFTKYHAMIASLCLLIGVQMISGSSAVLALGRGMGFMVDLVKLGDPAADGATLQRVIERAPRQSDTVLAFDVFSRTHPQKALDWASDPKNPVLEKSRPLRTAVDARRPVLEATVLTNKAVLLNEPLEVASVASMDNLLDLARTNPATAALLGRGRFTFDRLDQGGVTRVLTEHGATQGAESRIVVAPRLTRPVTPVRDDG